MRTITVLVGLLLTAFPAFAQSRVFTNADLGRPLSPGRATVTPEELAGLKAREFHLPTRRPAPDVTIVQHDPDWPFTTSTRDAIAEPLFKPWFMRTYVGRGYGGRRYGGPADRQPASPGADSRRR